MLRLKSNHLPVRFVRFGIIRSFIRSNASNSSTNAESLSVPGLQDFPNFLKAAEKRWKVKLERRFDRERYFGSKEIAESAEKLPRYILSMFPYPSGRLHLGHVRIYTSGDILSRYTRLLSRNENYEKDFSNVINPMGFDSFGLPAENAAKERHLDPASWTNSNIRVMKQQLDSLALQFDWREATSNPSFYKWTQELFLKLMDSNMIYKSYAQVNWDPIDKTVLADEQVDEEGRSWRSGAVVEKRYYRQWFVKVNAYTDAIYRAEDVDPDTWRDILLIQRNWIGQPSGWLFYLPVPTGNPNQTETLLVFTKKPELFMKKDVKLVISSDHWLNKVYGDSQEFKIKNPFRNDTMDVVTTNDIERLPTNCQATIESSGLEPDDMVLDREQVLVKAKLDGLGGYYTSDRYRDWLISRQRFWGTPIPVVHCQNCGHKGIPRESLPVTLPKTKNLNEKLRTNHLVDPDRVIAPIEELAPLDWLETDCPSCGSKSTRDCETFDTLFDSSWYFLRYATDPPADRPYDPDRAQPVWCYIGGKEHASMHLFYARFVTHFLHSKRLLKFKEPFKSLLVQGVVKSRTYKLRGRYLSDSEVNALADKSQLEVDYEKMSKSKGNGVDPQELLDEYGIDATRFCLMSYANPRTERLWRSKEEEFKDVLVYLRRVALTVADYQNVGQSLRGQQTNSRKIQELKPVELVERTAALVEARNRCSTDATYHIQETYQFRQYISALHTLLNPIRANLHNSTVYTKEFAEALAALLVMLNPLTPHLSEELWSYFSRCIINPLINDTQSPFKTSLQSSDQPWPLPDATYPLMVKVRATSSDEYVELIPISRDEFKGMTNDDVVRLVESHFEAKNDKCQVREVRKYDDLMATVVAQVDSIDLKKMEKKKSKKKKSLN